MSNEKKHWLFAENIEDSTTQLCKDYIRIIYKPS